MTAEHEFKVRDATSYDRLADSFDQHTEQYSTYAVDSLLAKVSPQRSGRIVDIGCGTGVVALTLAEREPGVTVTGIDLSDGMLAFAAAKAAKLKLGDRVEFIKGDAEALNLPGNSVDAVVSLYAWRHLPNPGKAAAEVFRVLRPGGLFAVAVGSGPKLASFAGIRAAINLPFRSLAKIRGRELSAGDHIDNLVARLLPDGGAGFRVTSSEWIGREYEIACPEDFWDLQTTFSSVARKRIADASEVQRARLRAVFDDECSAVLGRGGRLVYRVGAAIVAAEKKH